MERKIIYLDDAIDALRYAQHRFTVADEAGGMGTVKWSEDVIYFATAERVLAELPFAQPEQQWIPVTERLPEYDKPVLLSTAWCKTEIGFWTQRGWMIVACSYREFEQGAVTAWMPLPGPYAVMRGGEDDLLEG